MRSYRRVICCAAAVAVYTSSRAESFEMCPEKIEVAPQQLARPYPGWEFMNGDVTYWLRNVAFYDGHPRNRAEVLPDFDGERTQMFSLDESSTDHWIACSYVGTRVVLFRRLDPKVKRCTVFYDPNVWVRGSAKVHNVHCK